LAATWYFNRKVGVTLSGSKSDVQQGTGDVELDGYGLSGHYFVTEDLRLDLSFARQDQPTIFSTDTADSIGIRAAYRF